MKAEDLAADLGDQQPIFARDLLDALAVGWLGLIARLGGGLFDDLESKDGWVCSQGEPQAVGARRGAMLGVEGEVLAVAAQIEIGITPSMQFRGSVGRKNWIRRFMRPADKRDAVRQAQILR